MSAAEAVYLGDTPYDVAAARKAGRFPLSALTCGGWNDGEDLALRRCEIYATPAALLQSKTSIFG